jgi:quercetin dioxygenase-like cupin family protein
MGRTARHVGMVLAAACTLGASVAWTQDLVVPVYREPRHRQVFESGTTRVLDVQVHPGDTSLFHTHAEPILYVNFGNTQLRTQTYGQDWPAPTPGRGAGAGAAPPRPAAAPGPAVRVMSTTSYVEKPVTHRIQNVGTGFFHLIAVLNQTAGEDVTTPQANGFTGTPEMTNPWYRAYRFTLAPGEVARHRHAVPAVVVQASDGQAVVTAARTWGLNWPTAWAFFDRDESHEVRNAGRTPTEFVEVEVRQPRP